MSSTRHTHTTPTPSSCWKTRMQKSTGAQPRIHSPFSASSIDRPCAWSSSEKDAWGEVRDIRICSKQVAMSTEAKRGHWALSTAAHSCSAGPAPWPFTLLFLSQCHGPARALIPHYSLETRSIGTQYLLRTSTQKDGRGNNMQAYSKS